MLKNNDQLNTWKWIIMDDNDDADVWLYHIRQLNAVEDVLVMTNHHQPIAIGHLCVCLLL